MMVEGVCSERHEGTPQGGSRRRCRPTAVGRLDKEVGTPATALPGTLDDWTARAGRSGGRAGDGVGDANASWKTVRRKVNRQKPVVGLVGERQSGHRLGRGGTGIGRTPAGAKGSPARDHGRNRATIWSGWSSR